MGRLQLMLLFHAFMQCSRLEPLFTVLQNLFLCFGETFSIRIFICGFKCQLFLTRLCVVALDALTPASVHSL